MGRRESSRRPFFVRARLLDRPRRDDGQWRMSAIDPTAPAWASSALLTIDMQRDFGRPDGAAFIDGTDRVLPMVARLRGAFVAAGRPVFHATRLYLADGTNAERSRQRMIAASGPVVRPGHAGAALLPMGQREAQPDAAVALLAGEFLEVGLREWLFYKPRWSAFYGTRLADRLSALGIDTVVIAGCNFPNCPSATLFDATERDFRVVLAADAVSRFSDDGRQWCTGIGVVALDVETIADALSSH